MAIKDFLPSKKQETNTTSVQVVVETYEKVKDQLKQDGLTFHDLVNAAMLEYLATKKKRN